MTKVEMNTANDVNDAHQERLGSVAFGRRGCRASSVVNQRKPCNISTDKATPINIGTWNIRTLLKKGKLANVIHEMKRENIGILGLAEVRWQDDGDIISDGVRVVYAGGKEKQWGVAVLLDETVAKCVLDIETHGDRLIMVKIQAQPVNIVVIQVYMPTSAHEDSGVTIGWAGWTKSRGPPSVRGPRVPDTKNINANKLQLVNKFANSRARQKGRVLTVIHILKLDIC